MGIPITPILKKSLEEIDNELKEKFNVRLKIPDKIHQKRKASVLFEFFVLYNSVLALDPEKIQIILRGRGGASFLIPGIKQYKTVSKYGKTIEPSIVVQKTGEEFGFWFDRPFIYFKERIATLRPDIVIRKGKFELKDLSYKKEEKCQLYKDGILIAEFGIYSSASSFENNEYKIRISKELFGEKIYFKYKEEFVHPPLIIECKSFGAVLGNPQEYAEYGNSVAIVTPEKIYDPKKENLYVIKLENKKNLSNKDCREKLKKFYEQINFI
jgi:hypothetical protein